MEVLHFSEFLFSPCLSHSFRPHILGIRSEALEISPGAFSVLTSIIENEPYGHT